MNDGTLTFLPMIFRPVCFRHCQVLFHNPTLMVCFVLQTFWVRLVPRRVGRMCGNIAMGPWNPFWGQVNIFQTKVAKNHGRKSTTRTTSLTQVKATKFKLSLFEPCIDHYAICIRTRGIKYDYNWIALNSNMNNIQTNCHESNSISAHSNV